MLTTKDWLKFTPIFDDQSILIDPTSIKAIQDDRSRGVVILFLAGIHEPIMVKEKMGEVLDSYDRWVRRTNV